MKNKDFIKVATVCATSELISGTAYIVFFKHYPLMLRVSTIYLN